MVPNSGMGDFPFLIQELSEQTAPFAFTWVRQITGHLNPQWENFLVSSEDDTVKCQHVANPLGNGAIVETSDEKILVLQRSHNVGEFPGYYVFPGGHSEVTPTLFIPSFGTKLLQRKLSLDQASFVLDIAMWI